MKKKDSNKSVLGVVVLIVLLLIGWSLFSKKDSDVNVDADQTQEQSNDSSEVSNSATKKTVAKKTYYKKPVAKTTETPKEIEKTEVPTSNSTGLHHGTNEYLEARAAYGNYRLQVADCAVSPTALVVKKGSSILVDGFSESLQTVYIGETMVALGPNEAKPTVLNHVGSWGVDCKVDGRSTYNGATIKVVE